jgi:hypothetical protein
MAKAPGEFRRTNQVAAGLNQVQAAPNTKSGQCGLNHLELNQDFAAPQI